MSTVTLYEIANMRDVLDAWMAESDGELTPEIEALLADLDGKADEKIERVALYIREQLAEAAAIKIEEDRLTARRKAREKAGESLKHYLHAQLDRLGKTKVDGLLCTVAIQRNPPGVTCALTSDELSAIYKDRGASAVAPFIREVPATYRIDRDAVLLAHNAGDAIPSEIVVRVGTHLRIR